MPYQYPGEPAVSKIFVCISHKDDHAICMKATSQVAFYTSDPKKLAGVVFYPEGRIRFFSADTVIQPDNPHPIPHSAVARCIAEGSFVVLGTMPPEFGQSLLSAINASATMKPARKKNWIDILAAANTTE